MNASSRYCSTRSRASSVVLPRSISSGPMPRPPAPPSLARDTRTGAAVTLATGASLGALEPLPFRGDGAPDVGQERGRLGPGALEHRSRLLARAAFGVARGGQPRRRLGLTALQLARALGLRAVARVELGEQLAEPARVRGAVALGAQDQLRR